MVVLKDQLTDPLTEVTGDSSLPSLDKSQFYTEATKAARIRPGDEVVVVAKKFQNDCSS